MLPFLISFQRRLRRGILNACVDLLERRVNVSDAASRAGDPGPQQKRKAGSHLRLGWNYWCAIQLLRVEVNGLPENPAVNEHERQKQKLDAHEDVEVILLSLGT